MVDAALSGNLSAFRLPEVLTFLSTSRKDGTLTLKSGRKEASLFFAGGSLVYAGSNQEPFRLGSVLLRKKRITRNQQMTIDAVMARDGGLFGARAVEEGIITEPQLRDFLKVQVSEIVYDCFGWDGGTFSFRQEMDLPPHAVTISIDLGNLIMEGARRIEEWEQCVRLLPDKTVVYRVVPIPKDEKVTLTADEWRILFLVNGQRSLDDLCHVVEDDPTQVYRVVYGLLGNRLIEPVARTERAPDDTQTPAPPTPPPISPSPFEPLDQSEIVTDAPPLVSGDATMRQGAPVFHAESTMRDIDEDDTNLLVSSDANLSYADVVRPTIAQLIITNGDAKGRVIPLTEPEYAIGRLRENSIQIIDLGVSGLHARLYRGSEGYVIEDLKSRNGSWVNGGRVFHATLKHGDRVHLGQTDFMYEVLLEI